MTEEGLQIDPAIFTEILRHTDKKNVINLNERILRKAMVALVKSGHAMFLFLKDDESRDWWSKEVKRAATAVEQNRKAWREYEIKQKAWDRLSEQDRKILAIRKPVQPRNKL